uniref:SIR2 family protein n=1 Tax=Acidocella facilis TaxID=525 RepID=UPI001F2915AF
MEQGQLIQLLSESAPQFSWFLGAGASQSAGLPTAVDLMWDLKRRHYCLVENQQVSSNEIQNAAVKEKIDSYMRANGFPSSGDPDEYSRCFELIFQDNLERQQNYLQAILSNDKVSLSLGHRVLAAMMSYNAARVVITTNFDAVIEKAVAEVAKRDIAAFHLEGSYAANAALNKDEFPIYTKIHGDFRYQSLKNLTADLLEQDKELGKSVVNTCNRFGLVVVGYSGRDASVMSLFEAALSGTNPFPQGLFWTTLKGRKPLKQVGDLLEKAKAKGVTAELVEIETFDSLMSRLWRQLASRPSELIEAVNKSRAMTVNLPLSAPGTQKPIVRLNALPVTMLPQQCFELRFSKPQEWTDLRSAEGRANSRIICTKESEVWAWGHEA